MGPPGAVTRLGAALAALVTLAGTAAWPGRAALATPGGPSVSIRPAQQGKTPEPGGHFSFSLPAGAQLADAVAITNLGADKLVFDLYGADLHTVAGGAPAPTEPGEPLRSAGGWLAISQATVELAPGEDRTVPFSLAVPPDAGPGDYLGAVVVSLRSATPAGPGVQVRTRLALRVEVRVPGVVRLAGSVGPLKVHRTGGGESFTTTLTNQGNVSLTFSGDVVASHHGHVHALVHLEPRDVLLVPGGTVVLQGLWRHPPPWGSFLVRAAVRASGPAEQSRLLSSPGRHLLFFPWLLVVLGAAALLLLAVAVWLLWRRRVPLAEQLETRRYERRAVAEFKGRMRARGPAA